MNHLIASALASLKYSIQSKKSYAVLPYHTSVLGIVQCLLRNGFISSYRSILLTNENNIIKRKIYIQHKYESPLLQLKIISHGKLKRYTSLKNMRTNLWKKNISRTVYILSTNNGILSSNEIIHYNTGGFVLAQIN